MSKPTYLSSIRDQVRQRADMVNSSFVTDAELNQYINNSAAELYDILIQKFGNEYYISSSSISIVNGTDSYSLPSDFYKCLGVDITISGSDKRTLRRFNFEERNSQDLMTGDSYNLQYRIQGSNILFIPSPTGTYTGTLWYIPAFIDLEAVTPTAVTQASSAVYTVASHNYSTGQQLRGVSISESAYNVLQTITSTTATTITTDLDSSALNDPSSFGTLENTLDGVSGWEEYIIVDAAIKCLQKEESDVSVLILQKQQLLARIEAAAENRDAGEPSRIVDTESISDWGLYGNILI